MQLQLYGPQNLWVQCEDRVKWKSGLSFVVADMILKISLDMKKN